MNPSTHPDLAGARPCRAPGLFQIEILVTLLLLGSEVRADEFSDETKATTLFAFDNVSIPHTQNLGLKMHNPVRYERNPVLRRGDAGSVDAMGVQFYGSVLQEAGKYRMWYVAFDDDAESKVATVRWRAAYAESSDGVTWTKPNLGLVEFEGSRQNNLVDVGGEWGFVNLKVIRDEIDPDPSRRYKMTTHVYFRHHTRLGTLLPFVSADGFRWRPVIDVKPNRGELQKKDLLLPGFHLEPCGGLYQWDGMYYLTAQNAMPGIQHYQGRVTRIYRSIDFANWMPTNHVGFVRDTQHTWLGAGRSREGEQNHEGISVWNRGNILLGLYGRWHGASEWKDVRVDLGFVVSHDGLDFREPVHEWTFLKRGQDGEWDQGGILQGQGFENIGDETLLYYGSWDPRPTGGPPVPRGGVGIAMLPRDRFGDLRVDESAKGQGDYQLPTIVSEFVTTALAVSESETPRFFVNASGLGQEANLRIELLDLSEQPIPGRIARVEESGFQTALAWVDETEALPERIKVRATFEGEKKSEIRFHALYLLPSDNEFK